MATFNNMAHSDGTTTVNSTTIGQVGNHNLLYIPSLAVAEKPSILALDASNAGTRVTYYLWVDSTGDLRVHTAIPTDEDSDGTIVGSQS